MFRLLPKILAVFLAVIVISRSYIDFRARVESLQLFVFWTITWTVIVVLALFPAVVDFIISYFGRGVGIGTLLGMAVVLLFFLVYRIYTKLERMDQMLTKTIREIALREPWNTTK